MDDDEDYASGPMIGVIQQLTDRPIENPPPRRPIGFITRFPHQPQQPRAAAKKPARGRRRK
jgi:hypothetical protein